MEDRELFFDCTHPDKAQAPHSCPYASEIHNNDEEYCTCCDECEHQCAMDI